MYLSIRERERDREIEESLFFRLILCFRALSSFVSRKEDAEKKGISEFQNVTCAMCWCFGWVGCVLKKEMNGEGRDG